MTKTTPNFRPITAPLEASDLALNQLNDAMGVPTMVKPAGKPETGQTATQESPKPTAPAEGSQTEKSTPRVKKPAATSITPLNPTEKLTVDLPGYLTDSVKRYAAERRASARHQVMLGLQAIGHEVKPEDLAPDARRTRHKTGKP